MEIKTVYSDEFKKYGRVLTGYDTKKLLETLDATTSKPESGTFYCPSDENLEAIPVVSQFSANVYGGMPIQAGYCNGNNTKLNCLEYHRGSELNIPSENVILLLASLQDVENGKIDSSMTEAFLVEKGTAIQIYETTLHFAPCNDVTDEKSSENGFRVAIILPKGTNTPKPEISEITPEDKLLWAKNKWVLAHPDSPLAKKGAYVGLTGENIDLKTAPISRKA